MVHVGQMFWTPFGCVFGMQYQTDVNTRCKQHRQYRVSINPKSEGFNSSKSVIELRELCAAWRLCVRSEIPGRRACMRPQSHSALYGAEKYVCFSSSFLPAS